MALVSKNKSKILRGSNCFISQGEIIQGRYIEENTQEGSFKCLIFKKLFLKAYSSKQKWSGIQQT